VTTAYYHGILSIQKSARAIVNESVSRQYLLSVSYSLAGLLIFRRQIEKQQSLSVAMLMVLLLYKLDWSLEVSLLYRCCCCCYNLLSASPFPLSGCNCTVWLQLHGLAVDGIAKRNRESPTTTFISGLAPPLPLFNLLHSIDNPLTPNSVSFRGRMHWIRHECHVHANR
jgi:hypothetical protein